jgi:hypothetical protein
MAFFCLSVKTEILTASLWGCLRRMHLQLRGVWGGSHGTGFCAMGRQAGRGLGENSTPIEALRLAPGLKSIGPPGLEPELPVRTPPLQEKRGRDAPAGRLVACRL